VLPVGWGRREISFMGPLLLLCSALSILSEKLRAPPPQRRPGRIGHGHPPTRARPRQSPLP